MSCAGVSAFTLDKKTVDGGSTSSATALPSVPPPFAFVARQEVAARCRPAQREDRRSRVGGAFGARWA